MMGASWDEAISIPIEVMNRDFAFNQIEHQMDAQAEAVRSITTGSIK